MADNPDSNRPNDDLPNIEQCKRIETEAKQLTDDSVTGAVLIIARQHGIDTFPYTPPDFDSRQTSLWLLAALMKQIAVSTEEATGDNVHPLSVAEEAFKLMADTQASSPRDD